MIKREDLKRALHYNPDTGVFTWVGISKYHKEKQGAIAGGPQPSKSKLYWVIGLNKRIYRAHRLAWLYVYGYMPAMVDHINGDSLDNRIVNLRACDSIVNAQNHTRRKNESGLPTGVRSTPNGYQARLTVRGKVLHLGVYKTPEQASEIYEQKKVLLHDAPARLA